MDADEKSSHGFLSPIDKRKQRVSQRKREQFRCTRLRSIAICVHDEVVDGDAEAPNLICSGKAMHHSKRQCDTVDPSAVPKRLRSAIKENEDTSQPSSIVNSINHRVYDDDVQIPLCYAGGKSNQSSSGIQLTEDEEDVVQALFALAQAHAGNVCRKMDEDVLCETTEERIFADFAMEVPPVGRESDPSPHFGKSGSFYITHSDSNYTCQLKAFQDEQRLLLENALQCVRTSHHFHESEIMKHLGTTLDAVMLRQNQIAANNASDPVSTYCCPPFMFDAMKSRKKCLTHVYISCLIQMHQSQVRANLSPDACSEPRLTDGLTTCSSIASTKVNCMERDLAQAAISTPQTNMEAVAVNHCRQLPISEMWRTKKVDLSEKNIYMSTTSKSHCVHPFPVNPAFGAAQQGLHHQPNLRQKQEEDKKQQLQQLRELGRTQNLPHPSRQNWQFQNLASQQTIDLVPSTSNPPTGLCVAKCQPAAYHLI